ncbi:MAG: major capsid protein, partial [Eggerthellaceae bacterium]
SSKYEDESGKTQSYFPKDAAMVTFPNCGRVAYGAVTLMPYGRDNFETIAKARVSKLFVDNKNNTRAIELYSRPIAMPKVYTPYIFAGKVVG